jgi:hypothetical protein
MPTATDRSSQVLTECWPLELVQWKSLVPLRDKVPAEWWEVKLTGVCSKEDGRTEAEDTIDDSFKKLFWNGKKRDVGLVEGEQRLIFFPRKEKY